MKNSVLSVLLAIVVLFWTACMEITPFEEPEPEPPAEEVCGDDLDNDGDDLIDEDCAALQEICHNGRDDDGDTRIDEDCPALLDIPGNIVVIMRAPDASTDVVEDDAAEEPEEDAEKEEEEDALEDVPEDEVEDDAPEGPPEPVGYVTAEFRDYVENPADAVESRLYGDITDGTYASMPSGPPSALCAFGSWNDWSYDEGLVCMTWSESFTPGRPFYTRGGDTGFFFIHGENYFEVDLGRFDMVDTAPCYRAAAVRAGVTRLVLRCPSIPELDVCDNDVDDDHDGLIDRDDPDCDTFWEPPAMPDMTNFLSGVAIGGCVNFTGSFWFDSRDGYGLVRSLNTGEYINRITALHDSMDGCEDSPCFSVNYPGDGELVHFTLCGFTKVNPAVITSLGAVLQMDVSSLVLQGDLCLTDGNRAITAWGLGTCGGDSLPPDDEEVCDGYDNDGDGTIDEGFACVRGRTRSCATSCGSTGTQSCGNSCTWSTCQPPSETCNGVDDDCDGTVDEYCGGGDEGRFEIIGRDYGSYREIEVVATLNQDHSAALVDNPSELGEDEQIGSICVVYGSAPWESQIWDPYFYHEEPPPCVIYARDNQSVYLHLPAGTTTFLLFAIGTEGSPRHRAWFNVWEWELDNVHVTSGNIYSF
ncbi:hypothetical protein KJ969_04935 [Patescibacteria group bacterium]|nr:hypothetical protein [Patescibacteria group bacterium]MBU1921886.1 hypothetical protein [Patescibacteria group bacterium]